MTLTVRTVVTNALHLSGLVDVNETPDSSEAAFALAQLNMMALAWPLEGIHTGWSTVALADEFPLDESHQEGVTYMLAQRIGLSRGMQMSPTERSFVDRGYALLAADYKHLEGLRVDDGLQAMPSQRLLR